MRFGWTVHFLRTNYLQLTYVFVAKVNTWLLTFLLQSCDLQIHNKLHLDLFFSLRQHFFFASRGSLLLRSGATRNEAKLQIIADTAPLLVTSYFGATLLS